MDVLYWSHGKSFTIENMAQSLKAEDDNLSIDLVQNRGDKVEKHEKSPFGEVINVGDFDSETGMLYPLRLPSAVLSNVDVFLDACWHNRSVGHAYRIARLLFMGRAVARKMNLKKYDLVHFSFPIGAKEIIPFFCLGVECPVVVHLWGSDLFRVSDIGIIALQKRLLEICDHIVIATSEMGNTLQHKFGLEKESKLKKIKIGSTDEVYKNIGDKSKSKKILSIPEDATVVQIGHNAGKINQHKKIIKSISESDISSIEELFFVFPMTYHGSRGYIEEVKKYSNERLKNCIFLDDFLSDREVGGLRSRVDVTVNVPVTDAMNSAMTEALYAGSIVISGSWLPYQDLRRNGFEYFTVDSIEEIPSTIERMLQEKNIEQLRKHLRQVNKEVRQYASWEVRAQEWIQFYHQVVS
jgi:glycosyltransferase involved in cell wall biosynthesis